MPLLGKAAVAMWWTIEAAVRSEFADWHSHEHLPERMSIPGFHRGSRWTATDDPANVFVLYELADYATLTSPGYLDRLNQPTPWSTKMMPHHHGMVRSQARLAASHGGGIGGYAATVRLSPCPGETDALSAALESVLAVCATQPGLTGAHLLQTETPSVASPTTEQRIRGKDAVADWVVILAGYDRPRLQQALEAELGPAALAAMGALDGSIAAVHGLSYCLTPADLAVRNSAS